MTDILTNLSFSTTIYAFTLLQFLIVGANGAVHLGNRPEIYENVWAVASKQPSTPWPKKIDQNSGHAMTQTISNYPYRIVHYIFLLPIVLHHLERRSALYALARNEARPSITLRPTLVLQHLRPTLA
ncbi:hypothetical protein PoB_000587100 [Plakobranchus ocellatus]|uniref:Uncharacterized protein n=1 Tax=Plakobranchus ocellatus TaxID=259542 RepID=A0AAV3Y819_9GAST|nr:hypothetical protein PoB_000587100 [Plakobranchus ocellatus]